MSVATSATFAVTNPATGEPFASAPECTRAQLDEAFAAAAAAGPAWRAADERAATLGAAAGALAGATEELAPLLVAEQGKPLHEATLEVQAAAHWLAYYAALDVPDVVIRDDRTARVDVVRRPVGVVAAITPWNFPLLLACWKIGPALAAGCTMVLKPSPFTPLSTLAMARVLNGVLPAGVLNVVTGSGELGAWMTTHPAPRKISFTGSVPTGRHVARAAADDFKRVTLELGGNDAAIVLDDADPAVIARRLYATATLNAGQLCCAVKRVYVPEPMHHELVEALVEQARRVVVGDGMADGTTMGPLNNAGQRDRLTALLADALGAGATAAGGTAPDDLPGYFVAPTIVSGARAGMAIVDEEQFGPVLPVVAYRDLDRAVEEANASRFGLGGSVWGVDEERTEDVARRLECGTTWINTHMQNDPGQPFGGMKWSGIGVENGPWGLDAYTDLHVIHRAHV
ncbi:MAG TPA: aldehyde dehydrogenase family protein [Solirubrobacteraceae bacterium]